jgi:tripartite-type tricarboxylate transporter receptor subunit TctC
MTNGSWGAGSVAHVGTAMFEGATGVKMTHVPFKELPQVYVSLAIGDIDWAFGTAASAGPMVRAKKVRFLAYAGAKRLAGYSDVPTVAEAGSLPRLRVADLDGIVCAQGNAQAGHRAYRRRRGQGVGQS